MPKNDTQELINNIVKLSAKSTNELDENITQFIDIYHSQEKKYERAVKQNEFFLKQWDKQNILSNRINKRKDSMLEQQSRMAAMGEMMDAVAHQWKQPLNSLSMLSDLLRQDHKSGLLDDAYIEDMTDTANQQIEHMISTLNEFRTFFRPSKDVQQFTIFDCMQSVQVLLKDELISQNVNIHLDIDKEITIEGIPNEFKHLFINLISNAIDAFNEMKIKKRDIYVKTYKEDEKTYIEFEDNAGGVPETVINSIFKPDVTTKKEGKGTGIGLYMSSQIVQKHHGSINVHNSELGAFFTIILQ